MIEYQSGWRYWLFEILKDVIAQPIITSIGNHRFPMKHASITKHYKVNARIEIHKEKEKIMHKQSTLTTHSNWLFIHVGSWLSLISLGVGSLPLGWRVN